MNSSADVRRLTTGMHPENCVVRRFCRYAEVYLHNPWQYSIAC